MVCVELNASNHAVAVFAKSEEDELGTIVGDNGGANGETRQSWKALSLAVVEGVDLVFYARRSLPTGRKTLTNTNQNPYRVFCNEAT